MASYTYEYAKFPTSIMDRTTFKDVDDTIGLLINSIKTLQTSGKYQDAQALITANIDVLKPYILSTEYLNFLDEETRNIEIYVQGINAQGALAQAVFYQTTEPSGAKNMDVWIA